MYFENKINALSCIASIDWQSKNIIGHLNESYLVQEKLVGEEFVVDLVVDDEIKACIVCRYKKGLHNGSHSVYENLEVLDVNDSEYEELINYAKKAAKALGVNYGLAHLEIMNTSTGPILIEIYARLYKHLPEQGCTEFQR